MITISQFSSDGEKFLTPQYFSDNFFQICEEHREEGRALFFAFLIYDFCHPEIIKVLRDPDYWNGLDSLSGNTISVFAFHSPSAPPKQRSGHDELPEFSPSVIELLNQNFPSYSMCTMPQLLFFQVEKQSIQNFRIVGLRSCGVEAAFCEIRDILSDATSSVKSVLPEFYGNSAEIFNLVDNILHQRAIIQNISGGVAALTSISRLVKLFINLK